MARQWSSVKVPRELTQELRELRERTSKPNWLIITEALSFYKAAITNKSHFSITEKTDKIAYYIMKLVTSASYFKINKDKESLEKFKHTVEQLERRLNINCPELIPIAEKILKDPSGRNIHSLNMSLKSCILKLILSLEG